MPPSTEDFTHALKRLLHDASIDGWAMELEAGELHRHVGGYPGCDHRMPACCAAMRAAMRPSDEVVEQPPSGDGASLRVRYELPRVREPRVNYREDPPATLYHYVPKAHIDAFLEGRLLLRELARHRDDPGPTGDREEGWINKSRAGNRTFILCLSTSDVPGEAFAEAVRVRVTDPGALVERLRAWLEHMPLDRFREPGRIEVGPVRYVDGDIAPNATPAEVHERLLFTKRTTYADEHEWRIAIYRQWPMHALGIELGPLHDVVMEDR